EQEPARGRRLLRSRISYRNAHADTHTDPDSYSHANAYSYSNTYSDANSYAYSDTGADYAQCARLQGAGAAEGGPLLEWSYLEQHRHLSQRRADCHCAEHPRFLHRSHRGAWQGHLHLQGMRGRQSKLL